MAPRRSLSREAGEDGSVRATHPGDEFGHVRRFRHRGYPTHFRPVQACLTITNSPKSLKIHSTDWSRWPRKTWRQVPRRHKTRENPGRGHAARGRKQGDHSYGVWIDGFPAVRLTNFILNA